MARNLTDTDITAIAQAVWAKQTTDLPIGGIGAWIKSKLLTVAKFIGLR